MSNIPETADEQRKRLNRERAARHRERNRDLVRERGRLSKAKARAEQPDRARANSRRYYERHSEAIKERAREHRSTLSADVKRLQAAKWRDANRERYRLTQNRNLQRARAENPERFRAKARRLYYADHDRTLERTRAYRMANRAMASKATRAWQLRNPEQQRAIERARRAREYNAEGTHTPADIRKQYAAQDGACYYCGEKFPTSGTNRFHIDHVIPLSRGGSDWPENLVCACPPCNSSKHDQMPWEWMPDRFQAAQSAD